MLAEACSFFQSSQTPNALRQHTESAEQTNHKQQCKQLTCCLGTWFLSNRWVVVNEIIEQ